MITVIVDENLAPRPEQGLRVERLNIQALPADAITPGALRNADALLVRSVTKVDAALLGDNRRLRFVGTATAGTDHVDATVVHERDMAFAAAPGCNAESVADWVLAAIGEREADPAKAAQAPGLADCTVGIVGFGYTGSAVYRRLAGLARRCLVYDPFVAAPDAVDDIARLEACDILTLHVPLTRTRTHPTWNMIDEKFLRNLSDGALLINAARGEVVEPAALKNETKRLGLAIDVWSNEPAIDLELAKKARIATPHIAGHTVEAKARGQDMVWRALYAFFELPPAPPFVSRRNATGREAQGDGAIDLEHCRRAVGLAGMSARFKAALAAAENSGGDTGAVFKRLRRELGGRREVAR